MKTVRCPQCNLVNFSTAISCKRCSYFFQEVNLENVEPVPAENQPSNQYSQVNDFPGTSPQNFNAPTYPSNQNWTPPNQPQPNFNQNYQQNYQSSYQNSKPKLKLAVISMILGIMSFPLINTIIGIVLSMVLAIIFGVPGAFAGFIIALAILPTGLITSITALVKASKRPLEYGGKGFAIAGVCLSGLGVLVIPIVAAIAIPNLLAARKSANEGSAISSIRTLAGAQDTYMAVKNTANCGDLKELAQNGLIDPALGNGTKSGYIFVISRLPSGCEIFATPVNAKGTSATGTRSFYYSTNEKIIRGDNKFGATASSIDPPINSDYAPPQLNQRPKIASQK